MEYCKEMLGIPVHLVVYNSNYGTKKCKCCGQLIKNNEDKWLYKKGIFSKITFCNDTILYFATWQDENYKEYEEMISRRWIEDVIEWKESLWNEEPSKLDIEFNKTSNNISIFDLQYSSIEDSRCRSICY